MRFLLAALLTAAAVVPVTAAHACVTVRVDPDWVSNPEQILEPKFEPAVVRPAEC